MSGFFIAFVLFVLCNVISPKARRNLNRIIPFGVIWLIFGVVYALLERGILGYMSHYPSTKNVYDFKLNLTLTVISTTVVGLMIGAAEVLYLSNRFNKGSLARKIVLKTGIYISVIVGFLIVNTLVGNGVRLGVGLFDSKLWDSVWNFLSNFAFISVVLYIAPIILISLFILEVGDNLGQQVLKNFLTGKYHQPQQEERIFMFLDMKSSTTIAEKMGHQRYFEMLQNYYADLSSSILNCCGEIYQYVGDEVVITWEMEDGLRDNNVLQCFNEMKEALTAVAPKYQEKYGVVPSFKAGLHCGSVTTGEVGVLKKEIVFTGDVLNTTARIQGLCNELKTDLLISEHLVEKLPNQPKYSFQELGEFQLRGKGEMVRLFGVEC